MAGTFATWAGIPCFTAHFTRSRGWQSDVSEVEIPAPAVKALAVTLPPPGGLAKRPPDESVNLGSIRVDGLAGAAPVPAAIPCQGFLILAESDGVGEWSVVLGPLFVARAEAVYTPDDSAVARVRLYLVDERYFWPRGFMRRWSFNRRRGDGTIAADSVKPGLAPFTRAEIAAETALSMHRSHALSAAPAEWQTDTRACEFEPFSPAVAALSALVTEAGLEEPCLRLDNTIALHKAGEGRVGYARGGRGPNTLDFPPQARLYNDGQGQGAVTENGFPEEFVAVTGGVRVASVALDSWEPVLVLPDQDPEGRSATAVVNLTEERVRFLTDGRYGLEWLHRFILQPNAYQSVVGLSNELLDIFRTQPYRLFRCPGAVVETKVEKSGAKDFGAVYEPGPNAHLLPLQDRAETSAGRRMPVLIEASRFTTVHQALRGTEAQIRMAGILRAISALRATAPQRPSRLTNSLSTLQKIDAASVFSTPRARSGVFAGVSGIQEALDRVREIESYRGVPGGDTFADELEKLTLERLQAEQDLGAEPGGPEVFAVAKEIFALEKELRKLDTPFDLLDSSQLFDLLEEGDRRDQFLNKVEKLFEKIKKDREAKAARDRLGGETGDKPESMVLLKNLPRAEVKGKVYSAELGIVETDEIAVHVEIDPAAFKAGDPFPASPANVSHARAVPCPVRVTFGAVVRPRTDRPWQTSGLPTRPRTGADAPPLQRQPGETLNDFHLRRQRALDGDEKGAFRPEPNETPSQFLARRGRDCKPEPDVIPEALTDAESYYTAAFRRTGRGTGVRVPFDSLPREQAVIVHDPDFVELVPIAGNGNRVALDEQAERIALTRFLAAEQVQTTRTTLARPWPVQCDGLVSSVEIVMQFEGEVPCGFDTIVTSGGKAAAAKIRPRPRTGPRGAEREGLLTRARAT